MKLSEIFSQLSTGELSQLNVGGGRSGSIAEPDQMRVLNHVNLGLADLFSRFTIRQGQLTLVLVPEKRVYLLSAKYAVNNKRSSELIRYIVDTPEVPFQDDLTKIERVMTPAGYDLALNLWGNLESVHTPSPTVLQLPKVMFGTDVPDHLKVQELEVLYRAAHPKLAKGVGLFDPDRIEVNLPPVYLQALLYFIASRAHNPAGLTNEFHTGNSYAMKYEQECARLQMTNVQVDRGQHNTRLEDNGWV